MDHVTIYIILAGALVCATGYVAGAIILVGTAVAQIPNSKH